MAALRRQPPRSAPNTGMASDPYLTPAVRSTPTPSFGTTAPNCHPTINADILDTLRAATAPYIQDSNSPTHPELPMGLDATMTSADFAGPSNNADGFATPPPDFSDDATLPQLPHSLYGVELLPENPTTDEEDSWSPLPPSSDLNGEFPRSWEGA
jgi:hypothetical protein